jgi:regulator of protease activity HflC (stomatin/prohibitin superfamily)
MGCGCSCLDADESVIFDYPADKTIKHGPGWHSYCFATPKKVKKSTMTDTQYIKVTHKDKPANGELVEIIEGPLMFELDDPYALVGDVKNKPSLRENQYIVVEDNKTGDIKVISGPKLYTPGPFEKYSDMYAKSKLTDTQYIIVKDERTGKKKVVTGPKLFVPGPYEKVSSVKDMIVLNNTDYIYITHTDTGKIDIAQGPAKVTPGPYDQVSNIQKKIVLELDEFIKIIDNNTGIIRVEKGTGTVILKQYEKSIDKKQKAIKINEHAGVYITDALTGNIELIHMDKKKPFMFFPAANQVIKTKVEKIRLEEKECMVIVDKGEVTKITRFDMRPQYMDFEFLIRTKDNVEIYLDLNFYWQIIGVNKMILNTEDPPEDICKHAQSQILGEVSRKDMKEFMESFNEIVQKAVSKDDEFYNERGVKLIRVEITGRRCKDAKTEKLFQEIISEKTSRIANLEKKEGEIEVNKVSLRGEVEQEKIKGEIIGVKRTYMREEAKADGESEADKITNFLNNLPECLTKDEKLAIYYNEENSTRLETIANSNTSLTILPQDIELKIMNLNYNDGKPQDRPVIVPINDN